MKNKTEKALLICICLTIFFSLGIIIFMFLNNDTNKIVLNRKYYNENILNFPYLNYIYL